MRRLVNKSLANQRQDAHLGGLGGSPDFLLLMEILLFLAIRSPCKNLKSYSNPFWYFEQVVWREREKEREKEK